MVNGMKIFQFFKINLIWNVFKIKTLYTFYNLKDLNVKKKTQKTYQTSTFVKLKDHIIYNLKFYF